VNELGRKARVADFTVADIREIYAMRALLESEAAAEAAQQISPAALEHLRKQADALAKASGDPDWTHRAIEFDLDFHRVVAESSGNQRLARDIGRYRLLVRGMCRLTATPGNMRAALAEHLEILSALEARDPARARAAMAHHIEKRLEKVLDELA
jgi:DNA-binding GntR family transcriptional regulator